MTEPSIKRCTSVNKRKNSGSRWTTDNYITRGPRWFESVEPSWRQDAELRTSGRKMALGPQWPTVDQPQPRWGRSAAMVRRTFGSICSRLSPSSTHLSHTSNINPFFSFCKLPKEFECECSSSQRSNTCTGGDQV